MARAPLGSAAQLDGRLRLYADAFAEVPLRPEQRAEIDKALIEAHRRHQGASPARAELTAAIAAQVLSGSIDRAALAPKFAALAAERALAEPLDHAAMEQVHHLLEPSQREALVSALESAMQREHGDHEPHHGARRARGPHPMKRLGDELGLSSEQREKIRDALMKRHGEAADARHGEPSDGESAHGLGPMASRRAHFQQLAAAFKSNHFVMSELAVPGGHHAERPRDAMLDLIEVALPLLTPEQRTLAAGKLIEHATGGEGPSAHGL